MQGLNDDFATASHAFRFIAFCMVTQNSLAHATDAKDALRKAAESCDGHTEFLEVVDFGNSGKPIWQAAVPLYCARVGNVVAFRGNGYAPARPAIDMDD